MHVALFSLVALTARLGPHASPHGSLALVRPALQEGGAEHGSIRTQQICCDPLPPLLFSPLILPLRAVTLHTPRLQTPQIRGSSRLMLTAVVLARILEELTRVAQSLLTLTLPLLASLLFHTLLVLLLAAHA